MIGNPDTNWEVDDEPAMMEMLYMHNVVGKRDFDEWRNNQCYWNIVFDPPENPICKTLWEKTNRVFELINKYDIY